MKRFLIKISYTVLPVWLLLVGMAAYLWFSDDNTGDLMRLGLIDSGPEYTDSIRASLLPQVYYERHGSDSLLLADSCDVLVIGDSFSHGGGVGKQGDYVNYLAHDSGRRVVVYVSGDPTTTSPMQVAYDLMDRGVVDSTHIKNLVIEEVERYLVDRHCGFDARPERTITSSSAGAEALLKAEAGENPAAGVALTQQPQAGPLQRVRDYVFYHLFGRNPIYKARLSRPMFGGKEPDVLYFYNEDITRAVEIDAKRRDQIVDCYRHVMDMAQRRGVNLVLLVACDKYDLYQDFIVDNPYPARTLNEDIQRWMTPDELQRFVFSKQILHPLVEQGVKDVYLFNDTHWSPASSRLVAREVADKLI